MTRPSTLALSALVALLAAVAAAPAHAAPNVYPLEQEFQLSPGAERPIHWQWLRPGRFTARVAKVWPERPLPITLRCSGADVALQRVAGATYSAVGRPRGDCQLVARNPGRDALGVVLGLDFPGWAVFDVNVPQLLPREQRAQRPPTVFFSAGERDEIHADVTWHIDGARRLDTPGVVLEVWEVSGARRLLKSVSSSGTGNKLTLRWTKLPAHGQVARVEFVVRNTGRVPLKNLRFRGAYGVE
jgi:hypothetical protein